MARFTKKPVTIDAIPCWEVLNGATTGRFAESTLRNGETLVPQWVIDAFTNGTIGFESQSGEECVVINTKEGQMRGERADWLIRGVKGELYPCKPDIFAMTYETEQQPSPIVHGKLWEVYRCSQAAPNEACGIRESGEGILTLIVSDTNREECCHHMQLADAVHIVRLHNEHILGTTHIITIKGDMPPEQFAEFRKQWEASHASVSRAMILDSEVVERRQHVDHLYDQLDAAWGLIANAGGGDWKTQTSEWQEAAARWRDSYCTPNSVDQRLSLSEQGKMWAEAWNAKVERVHAQERLAVESGWVDLNKPEPPPVRRDDLRPAWDGVIEEFKQRYCVGDYLTDTSAASAVRDVLDDMVARDQAGRAKYGVPLTAHNGRDQLVDAYQEALDLSVYLRAAQDEGVSGASAVYSNTLHNIFWLRVAINGRASRAA